MTRMAAFGMWRRLIILLTAYAALFGSMIGSADAQELDRDLVPLCLAAAREGDTPAIRNAMEAAPVTELLRRGYGEAFQYDLHAVHNARSRIESNLAMIERDWEKIAAGLVDIESLTGEGTLPKNLKFHLVCGSPSDGYGFWFPEGVRQFIDVGNVETDFLPHLLTHEVWHVTFKTTYPNLLQAAESNPDPIAYLAYQQINEGVGHYYSFRRRLYPEISYEDWQQRTAGVFQLLHENVEDLQNTPDPAMAREKIYRSHAGVPFWKKWGAVPGAVMTYRLLEELGPEDVASLIAAGPCEFLGAYQSLADARSSWEQLPDVLLSASCKN